MPLYLKNVQIDKCGTGITASNDAQIYVDGLEITNTTHNIEFRDLEVAQAQGPGRGQGAAQAFMNSQLAQPGG
jgi:hypothetical protein